MNLYGYHYIDGERIDVFGYDEDKKQIVYEVGGKIRQCKGHYVCPRGGNPYPGTLISYYNIIMPNGKVRRLSIYA